MAGENIKKWGAIFIGIIVLFTATASIYDDASDAGDQLNASNLCAEASCFYNGSRTVACTQTNTTPADTTVCASSYSEGFPLAGLFGAGGVVFLLLAVGILFYVIKRKGY